VWGNISDDSHLQSENLLDNAEGVTQSMFGNQKQQSLSVAPSSVTEFDKWHSQVFVDVLVLRVVDFLSPEGHTPSVP
jgi:hypothetical protein